VHIGGIITPEIDAIRTWCAARGVWLFEDAAHAHGSALDGRMAGRFGRAAAFSFASTKVLTSGEGGMLVTDEDALAARARRLRDYGKPEPWVSLHAEVGANWRMSEFCAAVGVAHLRGLDERIAAREKVASVYSLALDPATGIQPVLPVGRSSWYKYIVLPPPGVDRARIRQAMAARGVALAGGVYDVPLHRQLVWSGESSAEFPLADDICGRHVCLPIYAGLTEEEARHVVAALTEVIRDQ
jgi:dTDP-4-amino-4,6-dideoxygalactose transaminase